MKNKSLANIFSRIWIPLIVLFVGLHFSLLNSLGWNLEYFPGDAGDARFNNYILEHGTRYLAGSQPEFWNAPFLHPEKSIIGYSDNLLGTMPFYALFRGFGADRETAFQLWTVVLAVLNFICAFAFLKWLTKNWYAAAIGAYIFAFSLALQSQMAHAQMFPRFFIPLAIWGALLFYEHLNPRYLFFTLIAVVGQFYAGIYLGFMLSVPIIVILLITVILKFKQLKTIVSIDHWWLKSLGAIGIPAILLWFLMRPYLAVSGKFNDLAYHNIQSSIPTIKSYFFPVYGSNWTVFEGLASDYPEFWDHQIFVGGIAVVSMIVLFAVVLFRVMRRSKIDQKWWVLMISSGVTFIFFLRFGDFSLYRFLFNIPGFDSMRSMTRIINVELVIFAVATALAFKLLSARWKPKYTWIFFIAFVPILAYDNYIQPEWTSRTKKWNIQTERAELKSKLAHIPEGSVVSYEPDSLKYSVSYYQLDMMIAAQDLNLITVNGYTARYPKNYVKYGWSLTADARKKWLESRNCKHHIYVIR